MLSPGFLRWAPWSVPLGTHREGLGNLRTRSLGALGINLTIPGCEWAPWVSCLHYQFEQLLLVIVEGAVNVVEILETVQTKRGKSKQFSRIQQKSKKKNNQDGLDNFPRCRNTGGCKNLLGQKRELRNSNR